MPHTYTYTNYGQKGQKILHTQKRREHVHFRVKLLPLLARVLLPPPITIRLATPPKSMCSVARALPSLFVVTFANKLQTHAQYSPSHSPAGKLPCTCKCTTMSSIPAIFQSYIEITTYSNLRSDIWTCTHGWGGREAHHPKPLQLSPPNVPWPPLQTNTHRYR